MISCGEPSGDLYAGALAAEIRRIDPGASITGFGGERLRAAGATLVDDFHGISVTGLLEVARVLPKTYATYRRLVASAEAERPDVFVAIDFPDFNFRLAAAMRRLRVPVVYYISPQLWAWRPGRMRTMKRIADRVLVIFEFEEALYRNAGIPVEWVGHPLLDVLPMPEPRDRFLTSIGLNATQPVVALLPGSRANELRAILPRLVQAALQIRARRPDAQFVLARAPHLSDELFTPVAELDRLPSNGGRVAVVRDKTDAVLAGADVAIVASGTVTVQAALHECPMIVVYRLSPLTYRLGRPFVHVDTFAMANLVAGRRVVPEFIQDDFTPDAVAAHAIELLERAFVRDRMRADLREVRSRLGLPGASQRAAEAVVSMGRRAG